jgi:hypothetical protein
MPFDRKMIQIPVDRSGAPRYSVLRPYRCIDTRERQGGLERDLNKHACANPDTRWSIPTNALMPTPPSDWSWLVARFISLLVTRLFERFFLLSLADWLRNHFRDQFRTIWRTAQGHLRDHLPERTKWMFPFSRALRRGSRRYFWRFLWVLFKELGNEVEELQIFYCVPSIVMRIIAAFPMHQELNLAFANSHLQGIFDFAESFLISSLDIFGQTNEESAFWLFLKLT